MAADPLDDYIDAVSKALALPVEEAWRPAVRANLEVSLRLARLVDAVRRASGGRDGHSSGTPVARRLKQPTRAAGPDGP